MKTLYGLKGFKGLTVPSVITVGVFDGVHIGHKKIIAQLLKEAKVFKLNPVVITFDPHPAKLLKQRGRVLMLSSLQHRLRLLEELGVELCVVIDFNRKFIEKDAESFLRDLLVNKLNMKKLVIGDKFSFGRERLKDPASLRSISKKLGFQVRIIRSKRYKSVAISSSVIRHFIEKGKLNIASRLLARPVSVLGTVIHGRKRGRIIGFKTANIDPHHEAIPPSGVYAVYSRIGKSNYRSVLNIGTRPTFNEKDPSIEAHIFGINRDLYGKVIEVSFVKKIRPEKKFENEDILRAQIIKDSIIAKKLFAKVQL
ncbi:MAG: bifunctional riboflavin kinase/FAD synthetase [Candidatus Orphnella occulta]|nr:bifunctional riboflavin kinase/FAD synthetase [Candidatus Orphnella occulta]